MARITRIRILIAYVVLLALCAVASTFAIREILLIRLDDEVDAALEQELLEFDQLREEGRNPVTGGPFQSVHEFLDLFLDRQVTSDDEAMLAYAEGELLKEKIARFPIDRLPQRQEQAFAAFSSETAEGGKTEGTFETRLGTARYRARRVVINDTTGALVVAIVPVGELNAIEELERWGIPTTLAVLIIASVIAWLIAWLITRTGSRAR